MHAPLAKFSMMRRLMSSAAWWLSNSAIDIDFRNNRAHDGIPVDPLRSSTVLMLHGDGVDASTNISDSTGRHTAYHYGLTFTVDDAQSKFGGSSVLIPNGGALIMLDNGADVGFGTGDFTVDCWLRLNSKNVTKVILNTASFGGAGGTSFLLAITSANKLLYTIGGPDLIVGSTSLDVNIWYHVALTRSSGSTKIFWMVFKREARTLIVIIIWVVMVLDFLLGTMFPVSTRWMVG
jgi:hypothetical protein